MDRWRVPFDISMRMIHPYWIDLLHLHPRGGGQERRRQFRGRVLLPWSSWCCSPPISYLPSTPHRYFPLVLLPIYSPSSIPCSSTTHSPIYTYTISSYITFLRSPTIPNTIPLILLLTIQHPSYLIHLLHYQILFFILPFLSFSPRLCAEIPRYTYSTPPTSLPIYLTFFFFSTVTRILPPNLFSSHNPYILYFSYQLPNNYLQSLSLSFTLSFSLSSTPLSPYISILIHLFPHSYHLILSLLLQF